MNKIMANLALIRQRLQSRMQELETRVRAIDADIRHKNHPLSNDWSEQAVERENEEVLEALGNASNNELAQIRRALQRIDDGSYQTCAVCSQTIPFERLQLLPHTIYCTQCADELER